uniref:Nuclear respiratory factor 1 NLS/DNA-binding dimerisation domain-containing protein n=1 Tax=Graphocephala atropunctata TaxID=36148 RepID=A0A1B6LQC8_9HEMI
MDPGASTSKGTGTEIEKKDEPGICITSNLPLVFVKGQPRAIEELTLAELEKFALFVIFCATGADLRKRMKQLNEKPKPDWWPKKLEYRFPLFQQGVNVVEKQKMLRYLINNCYTYHNGEILLKFSSDLAEVPITNLRYESNKTDKTVYIYNTETGKMVVKIGKLNMHYDGQKSQRRYRALNDSSLTPSKNKVHFVDLTFSSSKKYLKQLFPRDSGPSESSRKRRSTPALETEGPAVKRCSSRFQDSPVVISSDSEDESQDHFLSKFELRPKHLGELKTVKKPCKQKMARKKRLASCFTILSITSRRGQELLVNNKHSFNVESCLSRIERFCNTDELQDGGRGDANQVCTRASLQFSALLKQETYENIEKPQLNPNNGTEQNGPVDWVHMYRWPLRSRGARIAHKGPSIKPCSVALTLLSEENILFWTKRKRSVSTMTPTGWSMSKTSLCSCQRIPLIVLDDDDIHNKFKHKSSSMHCTCIRSKTQLTPPSQIKKSSLEMTPVHPDSESFSTARHRSQSESLSHSSRSVASNVYRSGPGLTRSVSHSFSRYKEGHGVISYSGRALHRVEPSLDFKRVLLRRPLAVVPSSPVVVDKEAPDICRVSSCVSQGSVYTSSMKINFCRSILDAIKWYTKNDTILESVDILQGRIVEEDTVTFGFDRSQENIKPLTELTLPRLKTQLDYFKRSSNTTERDHCFKKSSTSTSRLVTRRGERLHANREPCALCFQGRDNFCAYEFIRQAKLMGISLQKRQKQLQLMFFNFIQAENQEL